MAIRDVVVLNTTASRLETQQSSDTVRIKGSSSELLSIENSSGTSVLSVNTVADGITITGNLTASGNFSGSLSTTASFGNVNVTNLIGSAAGLINTDKDGTISGSAQIASDVSGSFTSGFEFTGTISGSSTSTGSFGTLRATNIVGDGSQLSNRLAPGFVTSSGNLSADISGSFNKGFEFTGEITGSSSSTASFGVLSAGLLVGDGSLLTNVTPDSSFSSSLQLASEISGSFNKGFIFSGTISGSSTTTASIALINSTKIVADGTALTNTTPLNTVSGAAQIASDISGSYSSGFSFTGAISGSSSTTASFGILNFNTVSGDISSLTNTTPPDVVSGSAQIASDVSGSFTSGFEFSGTISGSSESTGSFGRVVATTIAGDASLLTNSIPSNTVSGAAQIASDISGSFTSGFEFANNISGSSISTGSFTTLFANVVEGDALHLTNCRPETTVSASGVIGLDISGSFDEGFEFTNCITGVASTWASSGAMINTVNFGAGFGSQNAAVSACTNTTEEYNGTSWSANGGVGAAMSSSRECLVGVGTATAGLIFGGETVPAGGLADKSETFNGTIYAQTNTLNEGRKALGGAGTATAALAFGGLAPSVSNLSEEFDGTDWSEGSEMGTARSLLGGAGTQNAALAIGGKEPGYSALTEEYGGTSWSAGTALPSARACLAAVGTQNATIVFGGNVDGSTILNTTVEYDGSAWAARGNLITAVQKHNSAGSNEAGLSFGGGPVAKCTEEYQAASITSASFGKLVADTLKIGDISGLTNTYYGEGVVSSSAQMDTAVKGAFNKGFEYTGEIRTAKGAWSVGASPANGRYATGAVGVQTAMLAGGGAYPGTNPAGSPNYASHGLSEEYNGSAWSETNDMITGRQGTAPMGTQNAALLATGDNNVATEEYDGTSYATGGSVNKGRIRPGGAGTQNAGLAAGGYSPNGATQLGCTELYDGASWSNTTTLIAAGGMLQGGGSQNASIMIGRYHSNVPANQGLNLTELWNGTSWSEASDQVGILVYSFGGGGTVNAATKAGGRGVGVPSPAHTTQTERWDGVSWAIDTNLPAGIRGNRSGGSTPSQHMTFGGENPGTANYEYNDYFTTGSFGEIQTDNLYIKGDEKLRATKSFQIPTFKVDPVTGSLVTGVNASVGVSGSDAIADGKIPTPVGEVWFNSTENKLKFTFGVNAWKSSGNLINARAYAGGAGNSEAAIAVGGEPASADETTELYNGSTWSEDADIDVPRAQLQATGQQNSALIFGGQQVASPNATYDKTEAFNGTAWSEVNTLNKTRRLHYGLGTQNAALAASGRTVTPSSAIIADTEEWDGTSWYAAADINVAKGFGAAGGTQNAGIIFGGSASPIATNATVGQTETYDGTAWTERNDMINARQALGGSGTQNAAIAFGGTTDASNPNTTCTEEWNGTSWSAVNVLSTAIRNISGAGSQASAIAFSGYDSEYAVETQEYTVKFIKTACK